MADPKNTEQQSEELSFEQLEDAAGGGVECKVPPAIWTDGAGASLKKNKDAGTMQIRSDYGAVQ